MSTYKAEPPWEFLLSASRNSLQSYELSRLSHAANLRKEIMQLLDSWLEENSAAMLARLLMQEREHLAAHERCERPAVAAGVDERAAAGPGRSKTRNIASDNFFTDQAASPPEFRTRS